MTHATLVDTKLMGYNIPKQSFIIPNLYSVSLDPNYWKDPTKFNPDRFISDNGKLIKKDAFTPFSLGKYTLYPFNSLPVSGIVCHLMITFLNGLCQDKMSDLIWIQTV